MSDALQALPNLHGNPLAAIDIETTGVVGGYHEIIQLAIVPITLDLEIADVVPCYHTLRPDYPERYEKSSTKVHRLNVDDLLLNAPTQERVIDYVLEWFDTLPLGDTRRLTPIAHNWSFERSFLVPWLGPDLFNHLFTPFARDTMAFAIMVNDRANMLGQHSPFPLVGLSAMCNRFGIEIENAHDALADAIATAKLYSCLMRSFLR